jgi:hypothetical protein
LRRKQIRRELSELDVGALLNRTDPVSIETNSPMSRINCQVEFALLVRIADRRPGRSDPKPAPGPLPNEDHESLHSASSFPIRLSVGSFLSLPTLQEPRALLFSAPSLPSTTSIEMK